MFIVVVAFLVVAPLDTRQQDFVLFMLLDWLSASNNIDNTTAIAPCNNNLRNFLFLAISLCFLWLAMNFKNADKTAH